MRLGLAAAFACLIAAPAALHAQDGTPLLPERRFAYSSNTDFFGSDLNAIFDTTFEACRDACLYNDQCRAFTFNARSGSCFPKSSLTERTYYEGATSAAVLDTAPQFFALAQTRRAELDFLPESDFSWAYAAANELSNYHYVEDFPVAEYVSAAARERVAGNWADTVYFSGAAVLLSDAPDLWVAYADDLMGTYRAGNPAGIADPVGRAITAAINAYLRADNPALRASVLFTLSQALEANGRGQETVRALALAADLSPREEIVAARDRAMGMFGFRIVEHIVESDLATPRLCASFSEPLAEAGVDYAPYVQLPGSNLSVEASGNRLCVEGLTHGERYRVLFRGGLPSAKGDELAAAVPFDIYVRDRSPQVRFPGRGYVLPKAGDPAVPVVTVNATSLDLVLRRVSDRNIIRAIQEQYFGRPLDQWMEEYFTGPISEEVWRGTGMVETALNQDVTTRLPMAEAIQGLPPGIYALSARVTGEDIYETAAATQWFVISDLGLATMSGTDGLHVFVRALGSAEAKAGVTLTLLSRANTILGTAVTDAEGYALFPAGITRGTGGSAPALVTAEEGEADIAFLSLTDPEFDLSDRGVEGREAAPPIDVFLATDRGAYRAGETIYATALSRDGETMALDGLPLTAVLRRPDGVEYSRHLSQNSQAGGHVFALPVAASAPRGGWTLDIFADVDAPPLASTSVLVEDFLPERIDFTFALPEGRIALSDSPEVSLEADYLFGAPGADLAVYGSVTLTSTNTLPDYPGYVFGRYDAPFLSGATVFPDGLRTDTEGRVAFNLIFPEMEAADTPFRAEIVATVAEGSGRPVERREERIIAPPEAVIGIKPLSADPYGVVPLGTEARFDLIAVGADGARAGMPVEWEINRVEYRYQWYQYYGQWNWEPITTRSRVAFGTATLSPGEAVSVGGLVDWGSYELRVTRADGTYAASSVEFYAGWYAPADATETPDTLSVALDKPAYRTGDTATVKIEARFAGQGLVTVVSNRLIAMQAVALAEGENTVTFPVTDEWGTGAYVTATIIRPMDVQAGRNPARALGLAHAAVDPGERALQAAFEVPAEAEPRAPLDVALKVEGVAPGETAYVTIAAVDLGILNLTGFEAPDPQGHYFGQRKLGMGLRDVYGRLIDGMSGALGEIRSGGDALSEMRLEGTPPTEELVAYFTGPVQVDADGYARASFALPAFNGTVRLMAIAWSKSGVGQAEADVLVRDPVVLTATVPRFLAPGDESRLLLEIVHAKGPSGRVGLDVTAAGLTLVGQAPSGVDLAELGTQVVSVPFRAGEVGDHVIRVALTTPDGRQLLKELTVPVRVNDPEISRQSRFTLAAGDTFTFDAAVFTGLREGTGSATLSAGPLARFDAPGLLAALDRYPYGCTEQITSAAMPLLYFEAVAEAMGLASQETARERVNQAIKEVLINQSSGGSFGLWYPESGDLWLDAYVSDFLSRAKAQGFDVPELAFRLAMDNLRNQVNYYPDFEKGGQDLAYALFVLAREGAAAIGDLRYYTDAKGDQFATPLAAAQMGAALAAYGDVTRADAMFARASALITGSPELSPTLWRADYGTNLRDAAGVLALALESGSRAVDREALSALIANSRGYRSTQESVWTLLAAHSLIGNPISDLTVNGAAVDGPFVRVLEAETSGGALSIKNEGSAQEELTLTTFGVPETPEPAGGNGWGIARSYYTLDGQPASPESVAAGTRLVAVIEVTPFGSREARLMVNDPLPAGFEIDNPNLLAQGDIYALDWLNVSYARHAEFRAERFLAAVDHYGDQPFRLAYIVRAVSPGSFHHPAASVEDMYRPEFRAHTDAGRIAVTE
jgi:hypothetical protein